MNGVEFAENTAGQIHIVTKVQQIGYDDEKFFVVSGEIIPQYSADEILESELVEGRIGIIVWVVVKNYKKGDKQGRMTGIPPE